MAEIYRKQYGNKLKCIALSGNTVGRCIEYTVEDLKKHVLEQIKHCSRFAIQLAESAHISNMSHFIVFARFCFNNEIR